MTDHTLTATRVRMLADAAAMDHDELRERIAYLRSVTDDDVYGDDNLSASGWEELSVLEAERDKREFLANRERDADDGLQYADPRDEMDERRGL